MLEFLGRALRMMHDAEVSHRDKHWDKAVEIQRHAVELAQGSGALDTLTARLRLFEARAAAAPRVGK